MEVETEVWDWLAEQLLPGMLASEDEFIRVSAQETISGARQRIKTSGLLQSVSDDMINP